MTQAVPRKVTEVAVGVVFRRDGAVLLAVQDDGVGFDPEVTFPGHLGLHTMHERALGMAGSLEVVSSPGQGTRIVVRVPAEGSVSIV